MQATAVTSKGQVTIPQSVRRELGIQQGSRMAFNIVGQHVEMRLVEQPATALDDGFGLLKAAKPSVPADFDVATLLSMK